MEKKLLILPLLVFSVFASLALVSATTIILGTIYNEDYSEKIGDAEITVACDHGGDINYRYTTSSNIEGDTFGEYSVSFNETGHDGCNGGDVATVTAIKGDLFGSEFETVVDNMIGDLDVAIIDVPMTPEFGFFIGALTLLSGIGIFFIVRRN